MSSDSVRSMNYSSKLAKALLAMGATLGIATVVALTLDVHVNIPDWMIEVAMIKLAFVGAAGLLVAGALLGRHVKRQSALQANRDPMLGEPTPPLHQMSREPQGREVEKTER